jgi:type IV pilus assembly protein PilB
MGIAPFLISSSLIIACAQRLVRRICLGCKEPVTYPQQMFRDLGIPPGFFEGAQVFRGRGCERCSNTGYAGRMAIIEAMTITDELRKMIISRSSAMDIGNLAVSQGMKTLRMVALEKVKEGLTTLEQVLVVTAAAN